MKHSAYYAIIISSFLAGIDDCQLINRQPELTFLVYYWKKEDKQKRFKKLLDSCDP